MMKLNPYQLAVAGGVTGIGAALAFNGGALISALMSPSPLVTAGTLAAVAIGGCGGAVALWRRSWEVAGRWATVSAVALLSPFLLAGAGTTDQGLPVLAKADIPAYVARLSAESERERSVHRNEIAAAEKTITDLRLALATVESRQRELLQDEISAERRALEAAHAVLDAGRKAMLQQETKLRADRESERVALASLEARLKEKANAVDASLAAAKKQVAEAEARAVRLVAEADARAATQIAVSERARAAEAVKLRAELADSNNAALQSVAALRREFNDQGLAIMRDASASMKDNAARVEKVAPSLERVAEAAKLSADKANETMRGFPAVSNSVLKATMDTAVTRIAAETAAMRTAFDSASNRVETKVAEAVGTQKLLQAALGKDLMAAIEGLRVAHTTGSTQTVATMTNLTASVATLSEVSGKHGAELKARDERVVAALAEARIASAEVASQMVVMGKRMTEATDRVTKAAAGISTVNTQVGLIQAALKTLSKRVATPEEIKMLEGQLKELKSNAVAAGETIGSIKSDLDGTKVGLKAELDRTKAEVKGDLSTVREKLSDGEKARERLEANVQKLVTVTPTAAPSRFVPAQRVTAAPASLMVAAHQAWTAPPLKTASCGTLDLKDRSGWDVAMAIGYPGYLLESVDTDGGFVWAAGPNGQTEALPMLEVARLSGCKVGGQTAVSEKR